ncbi:MAG: KEOPS complex subunit Pcc1 [Candidatus Bathyarchaeia archaeon]
MDEVELKIHLEDKFKAIVLLKALEPDNKVLPVGLTIKSEVSDSTLIIRIESNVRVETLLNTLDDLLMCFLTAEKCIGSVEGRVET